MDPQRDVLRPPRGRRALALAAAVLCLGAATALAQDWNGSETILLGDDATSRFVGADLQGFPEAHRYTFFAPEGTKLSAALKPAKGASLVADLRLLRNGAEVDLGKALKGKEGKPKIRGFLIEEGGSYALEVRAASGTGAYTLVTKAGYPKKDKDTVETMSYEFDVVGPTLLKLAKVAGARGTKPVFTGLVGPDGAVAIGEAGKKLKKIELPTTGTYTLLFRDDAVGAKLQPGEFKVQLLLKGPKGDALVENAGGQNRVPFGFMDPGDPHNGMAAPGYVGSEACRQCHAEYVDGVLQSLHNGKMRSTRREGAAGYVIPPVVDALFKAAGGTDMRTAVPDKYGSLAYDLRLSYVAGADLPYKIQVGTTRYDVQYVMGGNGPWKQRYVVKIGNSHYITPVQYNEATGTWSNYHGEHWSANGPTAPKNSWERRCGACHATGILLSFDQASGEYLTGYAQLNIGCEACHGPGAAHVASRDEDDILNPRDLMDGTAEGVQAADLTCGQCHHRGGGGTPAGAPSGTGYPWNAGVGIFPPGGSEADFAGFYTTSSGIFFLEKTNPFPGVAKTHNASRQHHQQYLDLHNGPHAPNKGYDGACFDCHDAHASRADRPQMMATTITRGGVTYTDVEDRNNKLCLACHKGHGDFAAVTPTDVESITDTFAPARVVTAVRDHMSDKAAMPVGAASYTPAQDGTGRCSTCHMPYMSKSADYTLDRAGNAVGDVKSHMFWPVWPNISKKAAITNSCNGCHPIDAADVTGPVIEAWAQDHDADGTFHADTPRSFQNGVANAESAGGGMACASCHTTKGFIEAQVYGGQAALIASQADRDALVLDSITFDKGITCEACHGKQGDGTFAAGANPLRFPAADLCGKCHMNETIQFADYRDHGEIVRHPQQQMMDGVEAGEVPGREAQYQNSFHASLSCVDCHFALGEASNHSFAPRFASCTAAGCHQNQGLSDFNRIARADYDGDGTTEGVQDEVRGVRAILEAEILTTVTSTGAVITFDGSYFLIDGNRSNTAALNAVADAALMRAMFNHYWSRYEGSDGVHNTAYALQILQKSYEELTGSGWTVGTGGVTR